MEARDKIYGWTFKIIIISNLILLKLDIRINLISTSESKNQMESRFFLNIIVT